MPTAFADPPPLSRDGRATTQAPRPLRAETIHAAPKLALDAKQNNSYGLTTLKNRHVAIDGNEVRFRFTGKSGKEWSLRVRDRRVAKIIKACQELPGQELIQYVDEEGNCRDVTSSDVNNYR